jgi:putative transposase
VERNPVRAGMVEDPMQWKWSSAAAHCTGVSDGWLDMTQWQKRWTTATWREYLARGECTTGLDALRRSTHTGRPLGTPEFVAALEKSTLRVLAPRKGGRPKKPASDSRQSKLAVIA